MRKETHMKSKRKLFVKPLYVAKMALFFTICFSIPLSYGAQEKVCRKLSVSDCQNIFKWFKKAAEQGHTEAQYELALMYDMGEGVEYDFQKSFYWFEKAAQQGHSAAQYELALIYDVGDGVEKDFQKAFYWFKKAAKQGDTRAQNGLGLMYFYGAESLLLYGGEDAVVERDCKKSFKWFKAAAEQGHKPSQRYVKQMKKDVQKQSGSSKTKRRRQKDPFCRDDK